MKAFMDENFLLEGETAKKLYHDTAAKQSIIDYHNHLNPQEIYEDKRFSNISELWLGGDHYKWRAMRWNGISERLITGDADPYEKFLAWADTVPKLIGNPLYHWTHLELQRYFGIVTPLTPATADEIFRCCNEKLSMAEFSVRNLLRMQRVEVLCTTDDPADSLEWHKKIQGDRFEIKVLPSYRPEKVLGIEKAAFAFYIEKLSKVAGIEITDISSLLSALSLRLDFFSKNGCRVSDHSLEGDFYRQATMDEADGIFRHRMAGEVVTSEEIAKYKGYLLTELGKEYARRGMVMQLHIGALRNNAARFYHTIGADSGFDGISDFSYAPQLSALLNAMDEENALPKTILYCLNVRDMEMLCAMAGNFESNEEGIRGKVQLGAAWWFCDHKDGMERQMKVLSDMGLLSAFVGMLTDSRSFLSFPRHEYFRRILCNQIGGWIENGEYPMDEVYLKKLVAGICGENARDYFRF